MVRVALLAVVLAGCFRETSEYDVRLYGEGTDLGTIEAAAEPRTGAVEYARMRFWGSNLGHGLTGLFGDSPRQDGTSVVVGSASFGYPADPSYHRISAFVNPGPGQIDTCYTRIGGIQAAGAVEYVDVGDRVALSADDGAQIFLHRDPPFHPRPAGESWYVAYGGQLLPEITGDPRLPDTWRGGETFDLTFPGTLPPDDVTFGAIPYPLESGELRLPAEVAGVFVNGDEVRPPEHSEDADDDVRFAGPWWEALVVTWTPADPPEPLTLVVRVLAAGVEEACGCDDDCSAGFTCDAGDCVGVDGAGWNPVGELVCTARDDGEFTIGWEDAEHLYDWTVGYEGAVLGVARLAEGAFVPPDVLTWNGQRVPSAAVTTRGADIVWTRLRAPAE